MLETGGGATIGGAATGAGATAGTGVGAAAGWQFGVRIVVLVTEPMAAVMVALTGTALVEVAGAV
jgi:hypothetical protein